MRLGMWELVVILAIFVLLFGAKKLPDLADGMGKAIRNFKRGLAQPDEDVTPPEKQVTESSSAQDMKTRGLGRRDQELRARPRRIQRTGAEERPPAPGPCRRTGARRRRSPRWARPTGPHRVHRAARHVDDRRRRDWAFGIAEQHLARAAQREDQEIVQVVAVQRLGRAQRHDVVARVGVAADLDDLERLARRELRLASSAGRATVSRLPANSASSIAAGGAAAQPRVESRSVAPRSTPGIRVDAWPTRGEQEHECAWASGFAEHGAEHKRIHREAGPSREF